MNENNSTTTRNTANEMEAVPRRANLPTIQAWCGASLGMLASNCRPLVWYVSLHRRRRPLSHIGEEMPSLELDAAGEYFWRDDRGGKHGPFQYSYDAMNDAARRGADVPQIPTHLVCVVLIELHGE